MVLRKRSSLRGGARSTLLEMLSLLFFFIQDHGAAQQGGE